MKPTIAHINMQFFAKSETFIYFYLDAFKKSESLAVCWYPIVNQDLFPFPADNILSLYPTRYSPTWFLRGVAKRVFGLYLNRTSALNWLSQNKANLIHAHYGPVGWWSLVLKEKLNVPMVTTFYGYDLASDLGADIAYWHARRKTLFSKGNLFLVEGPFMRERLIHLGCPAEKILIQRIALPMNSIHFREARSAISDKSTILLFAGRFLEKKGIMDAIKAVQNVLQLGYQVEFNLIGNGPLYSRIEHYIITNGLDRHIKLLGFLNHDAYLEELKKSDIFIHPSVFSKDGDSEGGAPTTILEAQATGLPILSTIHADIPYVVDDSQSGILVHEHNVQELTQALIYLLEHPDRWPEMGRIGREKMEKEHDITKEAALLEERYAILLGKAKK
jgi:colanic acid/amylovoran biosynthesis glycosyltransferase